MLYKNSYVKLTPRKGLNGDLEDEIWPGKASQSADGRGCFFSIYIWKESVGRDLHIYNLGFGAANRNLQWLKEV